MSDHITIAHQPGWVILITWRCTQPAGHPHDHAAVHSGLLMAVWPADR